MKRSFSLASLSLIALSAIGCSINTNIPLFNPATMVEVVNDSSYDLSISVNGTVQVFETADGRVKDKLRTGESSALRFKNWSNHTSAEVAFVVKAFRPHSGQYWKTAQCRIYVHGSQAAHALIVKDEDLVRGWIRSNSGWPW